VKTVSVSSLLIVSICLAVLAAGCGTSDTASWKIAKVVKAVTASAVSVTYPPTPGRPAHIFSTSNPDDIFLLVAFVLSADGPAKDLDVQDIVLVVDESDQFLPDGYSNGVNSYVGKLSGVFTPGGADLHIEFDPAGTMDLTTDSISQGFVLIYVLPRHYVDDSHRLQLTIAGSGGVVVPVEAQSD
jgi:hypothetical protein